MDAIRARTIAILSCALLNACTTASTGKGARSSAFEARPPKPPDCDFELFEERAPPRPYKVLGTLPFESNMWLGTKGRKEALRATACKAGADAVLLPRPMVRLINLGNRHPEEIREYEAQFLVYTDVPEPQEAQAEPPPPRPPPGTLVVPSSEWMENTYGTAVRQAEPGETPSPR